MSNLILRITGELFQKHTNKRVSFFEIVSYDELVLQYPNPPTSIRVILKLKDQNNKVTSSCRGILAGLSDPKQPLTFNISVDSENGELIYSGIMILFNDRPKFKGRFFPMIESLMLSKAISSQETKKIITSILSSRKTNELLVKASIDPKHSKIMILKYDENANNLKSMISNTSFDENLALF